MVVRQRSSDSESRRKGNEDIQKESEIIPFHRHSTIKFIHNAQPMDKYKNKWILISYEKLVVRWSMKKMMPSASVFVFFLS